MQLPFLLQIMHLTVCAAHLVRPAGMGGLLLPKQRRVCAQQRLLPPVHAQGWRQRRTKCTQERSKRSQERCGSSTRCRQPCQGRCRGSTATGACCCKDERRYVRLCLCTPAAFHARQCFSSTVTDFKVLSRSDRDSTLKSQPADQAASGCRPAKSALLLTCCLCRCRCRPAATAFTACRQL
jgi:hypothetical protein